MSWACPKCQVIHMTECPKGTKPSQAIAVPEAAHYRCFCHGWYLTPKSAAQPCYVCGGAHEPYDEVAKKWGLAS